MEARASREPAREVWDAERETYGEVFRAAARARATVAGSDDGVQVHASGS